uniref:Uncharacterized protein n=1 Tax=Populus trichocarpa TaxID=3694 RepID=A0A2K1Y1M3_POPTR
MIWFQAPYPYWTGKKIRDSRAPFAYAQNIPSMFLSSQLQADNSSIMYLLILNYHVQYLVCFLIDETLIFFC